jgi:hypothetical protein
MITTTFKQQPLIDRLVVLLEESKAIAAAVADNAIDDHQPLSPEVLSFLQKELITIRRQVDAAS